MIKKCLITIAVVALLATTVQATEYPEFPPKIDGGWPFHWTITYDELPICTIDVMLEVGYYVQIFNCGDLEIKLNQVDCESMASAGGKEAVADEDVDTFPCYTGCVWDDERELPGFLTRANFDAVFGANFDATNRDPAEDMIGDRYDFKWADDINYIVGDGGDHELKLCMDAWGVELWNSGQGNTSTAVKVGELTIVVKPPLAIQEGTQENWPGDMP